MTKDIAKQQAGFKFGKYKLEIICQIAHWHYHGRTYKLIRVRTHEGREYISLRLYNETNKFIKQMLVEPEIADRIFKDIN